MSEATTTLHAKTRVPDGKGAARKLRASGWTPAVVYGPGRETLHFVVEPKEFINARKLFGRNKLYTIEVENGESIQALIKEIHVDELHQKLLHIDFWAADMTKSVTLPVRLNFTGRPVGVVKGGMFQVLRSSVLVVGLPGMVPESLELETTHMEIGDSLRSSDLSLPEGVKLDSDKDVEVATLIVPKAAVVEEAAEEAAEDDSVAAEPV